MKRISVVVLTAKIGNNRARPAKVDAGFASGRALKIKVAHDLIAKPLTLWRVMRCNWKRSNPAGKKS
jgi:hypothetical protein